MSVEDFTYPCALQNGAPYCTLSSKPWVQERDRSCWTSLVAIILSLKKAGKPPGCIPSYRPVSLTSCVANTLERILHNRLYFGVETLDWQCTEQAGLRKHRSSDGYLATQPNKTARPSVACKTFPSWGDIGYWNKQILGDSDRPVGVLNGANPKFSNHVRTYMFP